MSRDYLITWILWCIPVLLLAVLTWRYLAPTGERVVRLEMGGRSPFIQRFLPDERVRAGEEQNGDRFIAVLDEPVYFTLTPPPGNFSQVTIELLFDAENASLVELGALRDVSAQSFEFQPLVHTLLGNLSWHAYALADGLTLFSKHAIEDAEHFFTTSVDRSRIATYRASVPTPYRMPSYVPLSAEQTFTIDLRGTHELLTYLKNEQFAFGVTYTDINRTIGRDDGFVKVFNEAGELMLQEFLVDDGNELDDQQVSVQKTIELSADGWPEGVYRIAVSGTSDIMWRSLTTRQRYLVAKNRVHLGDSVGYTPHTQETILFTDSSRLTFEVQSAEGLQTLTVAGEDVVLEEVQSKVVHERTGAAVVPVVIPVSQVRITGEGKYAFSANSFFNPDPIALTAFTDVSASDIEYIVARVPEMRQVGAWNAASATFDLAGLAQENGAYKFALSIPDIQESGGIRIHVVTTTLRRPPLTAKQLYADVKHLVRQFLP